jgi:hypothetical protein
MRRVSAANICIARASRTLITQVRSNERCLSRKSCISQAILMVHKEYKRHATLRGSTSHQLTSRAPLHIESSLNMQFRVQTCVAQLFAVALLSSGAYASPAGTLAARDTELSCQACGIWGQGPANACCSASCIVKHQGFHGGYCDDRKHMKTMDEI